MIDLGREKIYLGDFHTHWYWDKENPTLFVAGMHNLGLDFVLLSDGWQRAQEIDNFCKEYEIPFRVFPGREFCFEFAHLVCWIDKSFEPDLLHKIPREDPWNFLKENTSLVVFAHPGENWKAAFDGDYKPLIELYRNGLIDAIQIQSEAPYLPFKNSRMNIGVLGGFDVHCCAPFSRYPFFLFNKNFHPFRHIQPCSKWITLVFTSSGKKREIIGAVKEGKTAIFNPSTSQLVGPENLIRKLEENKFIAKWQAQRGGKNKIKIAGKVVTDSKSHIKVSFPNKIDYIISSGDSLMTPRKFFKSEIKNFRVPRILERDNSYIPLTVKTGREAFFYGILARRGLKFKLFSMVKKKGKYLPYLDLRVSNQTYNIQKLALQIKFPSSVVDKKLEILPEKEKKILIPVSKVKFGNEYSVEIEVKNLKMKSVFLVSFPVAEYLKEGKSPWRINEGTAIILNKPSNISGIENWRGVEDLSAKVNLYWNEKNFYLYAEVKDDIFYQKWIDWETFWGDCFQFAFGPFLKNTDGYGYNYELAVSKTERGNEIFVWNTVKDGSTQTRKVYRDGDIEVLRNEEEKVTRYQLSLPWKFFAPFKPKEGERFLFSFVVLDHDGDVQKRKRLFYGEDIASRKSMRNSHSVTLINR